ncbi:MAG: hypothetical protein Q8844_02895 [Pigeon pea little leaf phytoplasma]|nr:hypothetical protein [Pigeon pea little leaf phytoplasma]
MIKIQQKETTPKTTSANLQQQQSQKIKNTNKKISNLSYYEEQKEGALKK